MIQSIDRVILLLFICFSFLQVTIFKTFALCLNIFISFFSFLIIKNKLIDKYDKKILLLFYVQPFLFLGETAILSFLLDKTYVDFIPSIAGRVFNYTVFMNIYICISSHNKKGILECCEIVDVYKKGIYILVFFALWQILNMIVGIPYPSFETRNYVHSMDLGVLSSIFKIRVTSLAREPAYLIPYIMDLFIIVYYTYARSLKKNIILTLISIIIFFTLSLSGYLNFFVIFFFILFFEKNKIKRNLLYIFFLLLIGLLFLKWGDIFLSVFGRLNPQKFQSTRVQEAYLPFFYMFENLNIFTFLFGYGVKGLRYVSMFLKYTGLFTGMTYPFEGGTSHIIWVDFFIDYGFVGFVMCITLFVYLYRIATRVYEVLNTRILHVMFINLFLTCFYTSDYASPRFTVVLLIFVSMYRMCKKIK